MIEHQEELSLDDEFKTLLPPLDESERSTLEQMILRDGILDPIFVWRGKIVDGHNRFQIAKEHNISFSTRILNLPDRNAVKQWILEYQLSRRSISAYDKIVIALKNEETFKAQARQNQTLSPGRGKKGRSTIEQPFAPIDVLKELGKVAGVGKTSVSKVKFILQYGNFEIQKKCSEGRLPIHTAYLQTIDHKRKNRKETNERPENDFKNEYGSFANKILCGDALTILKEIPDNFVTCFLFSPPYNNGTNYGYGIEQDSRPHKDYIEWLGQIISECCRCLRECGRLVINIDALGVRKDDVSYSDGTKYTTYADLVQKVRALNCGLIFRDEICWYKRQHGGKIAAWGSYLSPASPYIRRNHEYIIVWQKGKGSLQPTEGAISDLTKEDWNQAIYSVWEIGSENKRNKDHPSPFPEELAKRLIKLYSFPQDVICDPFNGIGTTTASAASLNRKWMGIDINPQYCQTALKRTLIYYGV